MFDTAGTVERVVVDRDAILSTIADGVSASTQKAYTQALNGLYKFYTSKGWVFFPAARNSAGETIVEPVAFIEQVLSYLRYQADENLTLSTINKTLSAVKNKVSQEHPSLFPVLVSPPVKMFMEGLTRQLREHEPKQASAFTVKQLGQIYQALPHTVRGVRDKALIALGVATALRASNLALMNLADVSRAITIDGLNVRVRFSKTDQTGEGTIIPVAKFEKKLFDPVNAVNDWLAVLKAYGYTATTHPKMPLFPTIRGDKSIQATRILHPSITITDMLRGVIIEAGITDEEDASKYSSHSLRSTFITLSNQAGVAEKDIARVSGHKDMGTLRGYDRTSQELSAQTAYLSGGDS